VQVREGKEVLFGLEAISDPDDRGFRTVMATADGQLRPVQVRDRSIAAETTAAEKADPGTPGHVAAPYDGAVTVSVAEGDTVEAGQTVATIEAMKMEASITAPVAGTVQRVAVPHTRAVEGGDLVLVLQ
jgi:pyruvate carboxylase